LSTFNHLLSQTKKQIKEVSPKETHDLLEKHIPPVLLDVRETEEIEQGFISGALKIPRGFLELRVETKIPAKDTPIIVYCAGGIRSVLAAKSLLDLGYTNVCSMSKGFGGWKEEGFKVSNSPVLTPEQKVRYSRHILLPEVGEEGQSKLLNSKVLLIGAGGLGSPAALYLAAAGIGTLGILDFDVVDLSNLQRQILHNNERIGMSKTTSAKIAIAEINPEVKVIEHNTKLSSENIFEIIKGYDIIVDGSDNFATRYLLNDAAYFLNKPIVHGSIFRFDGQVTVLVPNQGGPCYRCLFPEPPGPDSDLAPNCAEAGVLGVLPGTIGTLLATEVIKLVLGIGESLTSKLLVFDALDMSLRTLKTRKNSSCALCGKNPTITTLIDYEEFCNRPS
jgi:adenylyltransferase/sulfurtransferase